MLVTETNLLVIINAYYVVTRFSNTFWVSIRSHAFRKKRVCKWSLIYGLWWSLKINYKNNNVGVFIFYDSFLTLLFLKFKPIAFIGFREFFDQWLFLIFNTYNYVYMFLTTCVWYVRNERILIKSIYHGNSYWGVLFFKHLTIDK